MDPKDTLSQHRHFHQQRAVPESDESAEDWQAAMDKDASKLSNLPPPGSQEWKDWMGEYWDVEVKDSW